MIRKEEKSYALSIKRRLSAGHILVSLSQANGLCQHYMLCHLIKGPPSPRTKWVLLRVAFIGDIFTFRRVKIRNKNHYFRHYEVLDYLPPCAQSRRRKCMHTDALIQADI